MKNLDQIERYINHEMDDNELWEFERNLQNDPQLREEFNFVRALGKVSAQGKKNQLMALMDEIRHDEAKSKKLVLHPRRALAYAAGILLLMAAGLGIWRLANNQSNDSLYLAYFQPEPVSFAVRSATMSSDQPVMLGLELYENKEFEQAIEHFRQSPDNPMGRLYSGLAHMELGNFNNAVVDFKAILDQKDNLFTDQAAWYLSLCYLKTNRSKELETALRSIAGGRSIYKTKALKLMRELNMEVNN